MPAKAVDTKVAVLAGTNYLWRYTFVRTYLAKGLPQPLPPLTLLTAMDSSHCHDRRICISALSSIPDPAICLDYLYLPVLYRPGKESRIALIV